MSSASRDFLSLASLDDFLFGDFCDCSLLLVEDRGSVCLFTQLAVPGGWDRGMAWNR